MPHIAHKVGEDRDVSDVEVESVAVGDLLELHPHEICPVDGIVVEGNGSMDESYLTGEPFLISKAPGVTVLSGAINGNAALRVRATHVASDSRYAKIVEVLRASDENRPQIRRLGDRIGRWYTPLALTIAIGSWVISGNPDRFLSVLVIATPCPLLNAIPIAVIGAISVGARRGIVIRDPSVLEKIDSCRQLIVDKTGTLTYGKPVLTEILSVGARSSAELLQLAASLERYSKHPLSAALLEAGKEQNLPALDVQELSEAPGSGLTGIIADHQLTLTSRNKLARDLGEHLPPIAPGLECIMLVDRELAGVFRFQDQPRHESKPFLRHLKSHPAFEHVVLLSGDRPAEVALFAAWAGISQTHGGKSPEEKVAIVRELTQRTSTLYLGDGIKDAPAMMNATVGIALGVNSDITSEAAGAVILQSSLASVDELIHIGRRMRRIAVTSAVGGMFLSLLGMGAASAGWVTPVQGALAQEVIDLLSILNSLRMLLPTGPLSDF
jgi:heavy metal translocating P-type ATPase